MLNIKKYCYSALVVYVIAILLLLLAYFASLQLTMQRVQIEAANKLHNISLQQSIFIWDFQDFNADVVQSFQHYWQYNKANQQIIAKQATNPQVSLNFSAEVATTRLHQQIVIHSILAGDVTVQMQVKTSLDDEIFYYSPAIKLLGNIQTIELDFPWQGVSSITNAKSSKLWDRDIQKISSLVLYFSNPLGEIKINHITLPFATTNIQTSKHQVNCTGKVKGTVNSNTINIFTLQEKCYLPANYMWLKHLLQNKYPESILTLETTKLWQSAKVHKVNSSYTNITVLNLLLFCLVGFILLITFMLRKKYATHNIVIEEKWYQWAGKQLLFKGVSKVITPYHLVINYLFVLVPTIMLLLIMAYINFPSLAIFKSLPVYFLWALLQQFIIGYVLAQRVFYNHTQNRLIASILAGLVFSVLHLPSFTLMLVTFIAGCLWAYAWLVFKRLLPLALSHALLALMFYHVMPDRLLYSSKIFNWFWE